MIPRTRIHAIGVCEAKTRTDCIIAMLATAMVVCGTTPAKAQFFAPRPAWNVAVSWGYGPASIDGFGRLSQDHTIGGAPHFRLGYMLGQHAMVNFTWQSWLVEYGEPPIKIHQGLQAWSLGAAWFPGSAGSAWSGLFVRGAVGLGASTVGAKEVEEDTPQDLGIRELEKGLALLVEAGYEIRLPHEFSLGLKTSFQDFQIGGSFVERAQVIAVVVDLGLYF